MPVRLAPRPLFLAGREGLLAELDARLSGSTEPRLVALCGLGGAGKTTVAIEYAHRHLAEVGVCWQFPAEEPAVLAAEFAALAAQLGARDVVDARDPVASVHAVLARAQTEWLLVFDNVTDRASVERFIPPVGNGRVLVTTQSQHWSPGQAVDVPILDTDVAASFLINRTGDEDQVVALELAAALGGLPLALEQATAYMQAAGTSLARYLELFQDRRADLLARGEAAGHPADVSATLGLAMSRLMTKAPAAAGLLRLLAFLAPEPVPLGLIFASASAADLASMGAAAVIEPLLRDPIAAGDAIAALRRYSLVSPAGDGLLLVHRLVQAIARDQMSGEEAIQWRQAAAVLVGAAVPADAALPASWPAFALLMPHAQAVLELTSDGMSQIAIYLGQGGNDSAARDLFRLIADARTADNAYGPDHPGTLSARYEFARWLGNAGDAAGARDQFAALLPDYERVLGLNHVKTLSVRDTFALWIGNAGDVAGARDQYAVLLPIEEQVLGADHPITMIARNNSAFWTGEAGDPAGARDLFAALLADSERILGPHDLSTLTFRSNLAYWTTEAGDPAGARDLFAALLADSERILGDDHIRTLNTRRDLARSTGEAGDAVSARDQLAALLLTFTKVVGPEHPGTLATRRQFARWTREAGDAVGARGQLAALLPICERVLGHNHPTTLATLHELTTPAGDAAV